MSLSKRFALIALVVLFGACGSDVESVGMKCSKLASEHCNRVTQCARQRILNFFTSAHDEASFTAACTDNFEDEICSDAKATDTQYDRCLSELPGATCVVVNQGGTFVPDIDVPSACDGALQF